MLLSARQPLLDRGTIEHQVSLTAIVNTYAEMTHSFTVANLFNITPPLS